MKCINCGCENLDGTERCKKCEYPLNKKKHDRKYLFLYFFLFLYSFVIPIIILILSVKEISNSVLFIAVTMHFFAEIFAIYTTKSLFHTKDNFNKIIYNYDIFSLIVYFLLIGVFVKLDMYSLSLILSVLKVISYLISKRFVLKNKIPLKKWKYILLSSYVILLFVITNAIYPTSINKFLFLKFGNTNFSSKELQILLVDKYSSDVKNYFSSLSRKELKKIDELETNVAISDDDIKVMSNLENLTFKNFKGDIVLSNSTLKTINIDDCDINTLDLKNNISKIHIDNSKINTLNISNMDILTDITIIYSNLNDVKVINNSKLYNFNVGSEIKNILLENNLNIKKIDITSVDNLIYRNMENFADFLNNIDNISNRIKFKKLKFNDIEISLNNEQYIEFDHSFLHVSSSSLVKDLNIKNISYKIVDYFDNEVVNLDEKLDGKYLQLYENDNLIKKFSF